MRAQVEIHRKLAASRKEVDKRGKVFIPRVSFPLGRRSDGAFDPQREIGILSWRRLALNKDCAENMKDAHAAAKLGFLYHRGTDGVGQSDEHAELW